MQSLGLSVFTTAFLPGLVEEILFRGVLYSRLRKANPIKGILLSALLFGIAHELSAVFLCILFGYRIWMLIRGNGFHFCNHNCSHDF